MKKIIFVLLFFISLKSFSQVSTPSGYVGFNLKYDFLQGKFKRTLHMPAGGTSPTLYSGWIGAGALYFDSVGKKLRVWDGTYFRMYSDSVYRINDSSIVVQYGTRKDTLLIRGSGGGGGGGISNLNGLSGSSQTFAVGTAGTDFGIVSSSTTHTFNIPTASASNTGKLSSTDWSTFNNKQKTIVTDSSLAKATGSSSDTIIFRNYVNIKSFGAVGDGTTDNKTAIQNAINTGKDVFVPAGTFLTSGLINMKQNQRLFGAGWDCTIKITANTSALHPDSNCVVEHLHFLGNGKAGSGTFNSGIFLNTVTGFSITDCYFENFAGDTALNGGGGIFGSSINSANSDGGRIVNCYFSNNKCGLNLATRAEYVTVTGCTFGGNTLAFLAAAGNLTVTGNIIQNNTYGIRTLSTTNNGHGVFANNLINHNTYPLDLRGIVYGDGEQFSNNMIYYGAILINQCNNIKFSGGNWDAIDSIHIDSSFYLQRIGVHYGDNNALATFIPVSKYHSAEDFETIGEIQRDAAHANTWINQVHADTVKLQGIIYSGITATSTSSSDNVIVKDNSSGQSKLQNVGTVTMTMTNKRITARINSNASSATPTPSADNDDVYLLTALAANATFAAPTGTPTDGQVLTIRIKDNGTPRTLAWNAIYRFGDVASVGTTVANKTLYVQFMYDAADSKWDQLGAVNNF